MTILEEAWKKFGIIEPVGELAIHPDPGMRALVPLCKLYGALAPSLETHFSGLALLAYSLGLSTGRLEALENPAKAMQVEVQAMLATGVSESDIHTAMLVAMKGSG